MSADDRETSKVKVHSTSHFSPFTFDIAPLYTNSSIIAMHQSTFILQAIPVLIREI